MKGVERFAVSGCPDCPVNRNERCVLAASRDVNHEADGSPARIAPGRSPGWCPLRKAPTLLVMS